MAAKKYDIAIIGSGPAGQRAAIQGAKKGKKIVVIDRREYKLGGVSLHSGTIPSKTLREAVLYLKGLRRKKIYGKSRRFDEEITLDDLMERVEVILTFELKIIESQLRRNLVDILYGQASFLDTHTLEVVNRLGEKVGTVIADKIVIATGTIPRHPPDIHFDYKTIFDSNFIFSSKSKINELPKTLIVYGAGVIGSEYAAMFAALGCKVRLMDSHPSLFPYLDKKIVTLLQEHMEKMNVDLVMGHTYKTIETTAEGKARIETQKGAAFEADAILFSKGRIPCVEPLNLEKIGVDTTDRKIIKVNDKYQTSVENIFACGDVIGFPALASVSAEQGRVAARNALDLEIKHHKPELFPIAIYTIPEIAAIGKTEDQLIKENVPYEKGLAYFSEVAKAAIVGDDSGALKILFNPETLEILGVHIIGDQAAEIVHIGQLVMAFNGKLDSFVQNVFNYPTWAEAYKVAALNGLNRLQNNRLFK
jgi:NAD(P) transhydrogenase